MKKISASNFVFLLSPLLSIPFLLIDVYNKKKNGLIMLSFFIGVCVYLFLPHELMDSASRYKLYYDFKGVSLNQFYDEYLVFRPDFIFYSLIYLFAYFNIKYQILLFIFGVFNIGVPLYIFDKLIDKNKLSRKEYFQSVLLVFLSISLTFLFSGIRQLLAFNLILISFYFYLYKANFRAFLVFSFLAIITHFSAFIFPFVILSINKINYRFILLLSIIFILALLLFPKDYIQTLFLNIETNSEIYNEKIEAYSNTSIFNLTTTNATIIAKYLKDLWFYFFLIFLFTNNFNKKSNLFKVVLGVLIPIILFLTFPGISGRYISFLKIIASFVIITSFIHKKSFWFYLFLILFSFEPLYDVTRLMTDSFASIFSLEHITSFQILLEEYTTEDILK